MRRASASARDAVWVAAFLAIAALPVAAMLVPRAPLLLLAPTASRPVTHVAIETVGGSPAAALPPSTVGAGLSAAKQSVDAAVRTRVPAWARTGLLFLWGLGALILLTRLAVHLRVVRGVLRTADPADEPLTRLVAARAASLGVRPAPRVFVTSRVSMPATTGTWRPAILMPADSCDWPLDRLDAAVVHELAHIVRRDFPIYLLIQPGAPRRRARGRTAAHLHFE